MTRRPFGPAPTANSLTTLHSQMMPCAATCPTACMAEAVSPAQETALRRPQESRHRVLRVVRSFTDLLKLPRLHFSPFPFASRSIFGRNEVDLGQFETVLVLQHDARHRSPSLTLDNDKALIGPEPYLEGVFCPVWMRTDFFETELSKECERCPDGLGEFLLRWRLHHLPSPF